MVGGDFYREIWNGFACGSTPSGPMVKWIALADPAHQIGLQPTLHAILIEVESDGGGVEELVGGNFRPTKLEWFCLWLHIQRSCGIMLSPVLPLYYTFLC
jgi:hypothetical protein